MINIYPLNATSSFAVYPEKGRAATVVSSSYELQVTHSIDQSKKDFTVYALNSPNKLSYMLVMQYYSGSTSPAPNKTGQYTYRLKEGNFTDRIWGSTAIKYADLRKLWSNTTYLSGSEIIDDGRMYIHDAYDVTASTFTNYTGSNQNATNTIYYTYGG